MPEVEARKSIPDVSSPPERSFSLEGVIFLPCYFFSFYFSFVIFGPCSRVVPERWELWTSRCWARCRRSDPSSPAPRRLKLQTAARPPRRGRAAGGPPQRTRRRPRRRDPKADAPSPFAGRSPRRSCSAAALSGTVCYSSVSVALEKLYIQHLRFKFPF